MKYAFSLVLGLLVGAVLFVLGLYLNPFSGRATVSPLAVTSERVIDLSFSAVPGEGILYTDHGETVVKPHPERIAELWEPAVHETSVYVTTVANSRGGFAGLGIKLSSRSEQTAVVKGDAIANSVWHIYLRGQGTLLIDQTENFWSYIREVVIPARTSAGDNWVGSFHTITTNGPGSLGTARVTGGSGLFEGMTSESVEALTARGYSAISGPVSIDGNLTVELPELAAASE
jgi:hypothetical protein